MSELNEKCAVFGIWGKGLDASRVTFFGLYALQHRGQESSGIAATDGQGLRRHQGAGLVAHVYNEQAIEQLSGHGAIGHNRYSTSAGSGLRHAQPIVIADNGRVPAQEGFAEVPRPLLALAHNGNLPSVAALQSFLGERGIAVDGLSDSELMAEALGWHMRQGVTLKEAVIRSYPLFTGAFSLLVMDTSCLIAVRDPFGIRPLSMGRMNGSVIFASENCALKTVGADFEKEVRPGEMVVVTDEGDEAVQIAPPTPKLDIFEFVYFARNDSTINGRSVYQVRKNFGAQLARECPIAADIVVPIPETGIPAALGYSQESGIPFEMGLARNRYIHRTFIEPEQHSRDLGVKMKLLPLSTVLRGQRVVLMDDSIVRGTTSRQIVKALFDAGAKEVHFLVSSPPIKYPDFYGIDISRQKDLIAAQKSVEEIRAYLGATSLHYLSLQGMVEATGLPADEFCLSCFTGEYPLDIKERAGEITSRP